MIYKYLIDRPDHLLAQFSENPYKVLSGFISVHTCWVTLVFGGIHILQYAFSGIV